MASANFFTPFNSDIVSFNHGFLVSSTPTHVQFTTGATVFNYFGSGFATDAGGNFTSGTVSSIDFSVLGPMQYQMLGLNASMATLSALQRGGSFQTMLATLFNGDDALMGSQGSDVLDGFAGNDAIVGSGGDDVLRGNTGNDILSGGSGNDTIDGGTGLDKAVYAGNRSAYTLTRTGNTFQVSTASTNEGTDTVTNVERLGFADKNIAFDLGLGESAGNTVRLIGAALDAPSIIPAYVRLGIDLFDAGTSMLQVAQYALSTNEFVSLAGSHSNVDFVNTVYRNIVGQLPSVSELNHYVSLLQGSGGTMTQAELLVFAANLDVNAANIGLTGLQQTGVEYA
jgi:serralysin